MKGDFTRLTFDPEKAYTGVLQQQGRVQLDADWNEQVEISAYRDRMVVVDVIGPCGAPERGGGFAVSCTEDADLRLSPGRLYVGGTLCVLDAETSYFQQPHVPSAAPISPQDGRTDLVYLDVWQRHITAIEDPDIREPALGGPDTATRLKTVWQARVLTDVATAGCHDPIDDWPPQASNARLGATINRSRPRPSEDVELPPSGGFAALENHLYRVEVHESGGMGAATFKWSRDNGSVALAARELRAIAPDGEKTEVLVEQFRRGEVALREGDWVEVLGDEGELMLAPGTMTRVEAVDEDRQVVWLDGDLSSHAHESHLKLRRWDQRGPALPITEEMVELEAGIAVQFSGGSFSTSDYWLFPVREASAATEWPPTPPRGIRHDYCKLALVKWQKASTGTWTGAVTDCRSLFGSLAADPADPCARCRQEIAELRGMFREQERQLSQLRARLG